MLGGKQNEWTKDIERRSETKQIFANEELKEKLERIQSGRPLTPTEELASTIRAIEPYGHTEK